MKQTTCNNVQTSVKKIFITGVSGYIGGTIAALLKQKGYVVSGLVRNEQAAGYLEEKGYLVFRGSLRDTAVVQHAIQQTDAIIHTADSDSIGFAKILINLVIGTGKTLIYTSGSSLIAEMLDGDKSNFIYTEDYPVSLHSHQGNRVVINHAILRAAKENVRSMVIVPGMVYGNGLGYSKESKQLPMLVHAAQNNNHTVYIGKGENTWNNIHVEDLAELYIAALEHAKAGSLYFAENGENSFKEIAYALNATLGFSNASQSITPEQAAEIWGAELASLALGSNSRINADKARALLPWQPKHSNMLQWIKNKYNISSQELTETTSK